MKKIYLSLLLSFLLPLSAHAQKLTNINEVAGRATDIGTTIVILAISFSVVWIIVSVVRYLIAGDSSDKRKEGGYRILYGVIGLFAILSIWGLVAILRNSFSTNSDRPDIRIDLPRGPGVPAGPSGSTGSSFNNTLPGGNANPENF